MTENVKVAVSGAAGRMGVSACDAIEGAEGLELVGKADPVTGSALADALADADVLVDFSTPDSAPENALEAIEAGVHAVVGTTGFDLEGLRTDVERAPGDARCLVVPNFAIGAVLMMRFAAAASRILPDWEIVELHHDQKRDSPSGTAKRTAELISDAGGGEGPIHSVRLPGLVAHQEVIFGSEGETLTIRHDALDRTCFMPGVLVAVRGVSGLAERFTVGLEELLDV